MVILAWGLDKPLTLNFDIFETIVGECAHSVYDLLLNASQLLLPLL
jgi:hypothetical protein